jgi:putative acyl-CoA dehydrogenase
VRTAADFVSAALSAPDAEARARAAVERLAVIAAAAALQATAPAVAGQFAHARLGEGRSALLGTSDLPASEARGLLERALPSE